MGGKICFIEILLEVFTSEGPHNFIMVFMQPGLAQSVACLALLSRVDRFNSCMAHCFTSCQLLVKG